jgi:hypothetical protein
MKSLMTGQDRPELRLVNGSAPEGRQRFGQAHPEAVILPPSAGRWRAVAGGRTLGAWDLCDLAGEDYPPEGYRTRRTTRKCGSG